MYVRCPVSCKSQLQTKIALLSPGIEDTELLYTLRDTIQNMELLKVMRKLGFPIQLIDPKVHCKLFEYNSGVIKITTTRK